MKSYFSIIILVFILTACNKEQHSDLLPLLYTEEVTNISEEGAFFSAKVINGYNSDIKEYGFVWSKVDNPTIDRSDKYIIYNPLESENFNQLVTTTLEAGEVYYVRSYLKTLV
nr:hypothetical protein [uncultured Carboxylicivirga sp.]